VAFEHGIKDGEDILQATLLKVYLHADSLNFGVWTTWATRIALNLCRDIVRREQTLRRIRPPYRGEIQDVLHVSDTKEPVQELVERRELGEELTSVLDALPPLYRRAIYMRHVENRSVKEIATREGLTESAVKSLLFRARAAARKLYENSIQTSARDGVGARQDGAL
jgi:RNA polymerase sigma-70 factor (ECF subfamily)